MATGKTSRWAEIRADKTATDASKARYDATYRSVLETRRVLQLIEAEREKSGISKAELAQRMGISASAVRRLLTSKTSNPTLSTILGMFRALNIPFPGVNT